MRYTEEDGHAVSLRRMSSPPRVEAMNRSIEHHVTAVREVLARGFDAAAARHEVALADALGAVLARAVRAPVALPPFTNSQMDGYAVRSTELAELANPGRDVRLTVSGIQAAGAEPSVLRPGTCMAVMTGAALPEGADAVIPVERVVPPDFDTPHVVITPEVARETTAGAFVRAEGSDVAEGSVALPAGTVLGPAAVGACAALGIAASDPVSVRRGPSVLVVTGGDEVVEPGQPLRPGTVHDANGPLLEAWLHHAGAADVQRLRISDDPEAFADSLGRAVEGNRPHLIVTSGGISAGAFEVVRSTLEDQAEMWFGHVAMQPGGPQGCGVYRGIPVVCLPGNPVSTWVSCEMFLRPALATTWGCCAEPSWHSAVLAEPVRGVRGKTQVRRGVVEPGPREGDAVREPAVRCVGGASSHLLMSAARATVLLRIPEGDRQLPTGTRVQIMPVAGGTTMTGDDQ